MTISTVWNILKLEMAVILCRSSTWCFSFVYYNAFTATHSTSNDCTEHYTSLCKYATFSCINITHCFHPFVTYCSYSTWCWLPLWIIIVFNKLWSTAVYTSLALLGLAKLFYKIAALMNILPIFLVSYNLTDVKH